MPWFCWILFWRGAVELERSWRRWSAITPGKLWRCSRPLKKNIMSIGLGTPFVLACEALQSIDTQDSVLEMWNFNNFSDSAQAMHLRWFESPSVSMLWRVDGLRFGDLALDVSMGSGEIILIKKHRAWGHLLGWLQSLLPGLSLVAEVTG